MLRFKKYFIFAGIFISYYLLISLIYLLTNISYNVISSILLISYIILFTLLSFIIAKKSNKKGIIIGLELSSIYIVILLLLSLLFKCNINFNSIVYYLIILLSSLFGSILSKNLKK